MTTPSLDELRALAQALTFDPTLRVFQGRPGEGWALLPISGDIMVDPLDLDDLPGDEVRGLLCHEAAHAVVTRYPHLVPDDTLHLAGLATLLNALEDCRIEEWIFHRLPGARPWITAINNRLYAFHRGGDFALLPWFQQFCLGLIWQWWNGSTPEGMAEPVRAALEATHGARERVLALHPPQSADVPLERVARYAGHPVAQRYHTADAVMPPGPFERAVRLDAYTQWRIVWTEIWPVYATLLASAPPGFATDPAEEQAFLRQIHATTDDIPIHAGPHSALDAPPPTALIRAAGGGALAVAPAPAGRGAVAWERVRVEVQAHADALHDALERVLQEGRAPKYRSGLPYGSSVHLPSVMQAEADPRRKSALWRRKMPHPRRDPAFLLLVDLSGSMAGGRISQAFRALVLVSEVLGRLAVPFAVWGFQDVPMTFKAFSDPWDGAVRDRVGSLPAEVEGLRPLGRNRPQHNHDGPALRAAARSLAAFPAQQRVLIVLSDGEPSGPGDGRRALREAIADVPRDIELIGLGIGPGTGHVAAFYPVHQADLALADLPEALARCVSARVLA